MRKFKSPCHDADLIKVRKNSYKCKKCRRFTKKKTDIHQEKIIKYINVGNFLVLPIEEFKEHFVYAKSYRQYDKSFIEVYFNNEIGKYNIQIAPDGILSARDVANNIWDEFIKALKNI